MLIFSRRDQESFMIGDNIEIIVLERRGNQTRIGVKAPKNIVIHRKEIYERIQTEKAAAEEHHVPKVPASTPS